MTGPTDRPKNIYECNVCRKPYVKKGCLTNHMKNVHKLIDSNTEQGFLDSTSYSELDRDETILRTVGQVLTDGFVRDILDLEEDNFENTKEGSQEVIDVTMNQEPNSSVNILEKSITISSPITKLNAPVPVPLCQKANKYIIEKGKTLPASFLTTLLPAPGFMDEINNSLDIQEDQTQVSDLLTRFEEEIKVHKCTKCDFTSLGSNRMRKHMEEDHQPDGGPMTQERSQPSIEWCNEYLATMKSNLDHQSTLISQQFTMISQQSTMINRLLSIYDVKNPENLSTTVTNRSINIVEIEDDDRVHYFKCQACPFKANSPSNLDNHIVTKHNQQPAAVECPMCNYKNISETVVNKHIVEKHPEKQFSCHICNYKHNIEIEVTKHMQEHITENNPHQCPMCSYTTNSEADINKHMEEMHPDNQYLDRHKCTKCDQELCSTSELKQHIKSTHISCDKCKSEFDTERDLDIHVTDNHVSKAKFKSTLLLGDSHSKYQNPRRIEKAMGGKGLFTPGSIQPRTGRAYCSTRNWPNSRYPDNNLADKVTEHMKTREHSHLIFGAPGNDISNIGNIQDKTEQHKLAVQSSKNCIDIAEKALRKFPKLEKVIIPERLPRADHLSDLSEYSNFALRTLAEKSTLSSRILVVPMEALHYTTHERMVSIFGSTNSHNFDGIHLNGKLGSRLYNDCLISAVRAAGIYTPRVLVQSQEEQISTSNRFEGLN